MKKNLGRFLFLLVVVWHVEISASTYKWSATANKTSAKVNEAIYLKYVCEFSDPSELYTIEFNPKRESDDYSLRLLKESEQIVGNKRVNSYEFVAFAKRSTSLHFDFNVTMKETTQESIDSTILGRDNAQEAQFTSTTQQLKTLVVDVSKVESELVGTFTMEIQKEKPTVNAYEPFHMQITINGVGNFQALKPFDFQIEGVKVFSQKVIENLELSKDGYSGSWSQKFAFVSEKEFTIPKVTIPYFNIEQNILKELEANAINVSVKKAFTKEELLDKEEETQEDFSTYIYFALTFLAGVLVGKMKLRKRAVPHAKDLLFQQKVQNAKSVDELLILLALEDSKTYSSLISQVEKKELSLREIKSKILKI